LKEARTGDPGAPRRELWRFPALSVLFLVLAFQTPASGQKSGHPDFSRRQGKLTEILSADSKEIPMDRLAVRVLAMGFSLLATRKTDSPCREGFEAVGLVRGKLGKRAYIFADTSGDHQFLVVLTPATGAKVHEGQYVGATLRICLKDRWELRSLAMDNGFERDFPAFFEEGTR
jgi:hypothetical protein